MSVTQHHLWEHLPAREYVDKLLKSYGKPSTKAPKFLEWQAVAGFSPLRVTDGGPGIRFVQRRQAFLTGHYRMAFEPHKLIGLEGIAPGRFDGVPGKLIVRGHSLAELAVLVGFAQDYFKGTAFKPYIHTLRERLLHQKTPPWFRDQLGEIHEQASTQVPQAHR